MPERAGDIHELAWWSRKVSYLDAKPEWECWSRNSPQLGYAVVSLVALLFYIRKFTSNLPLLDCLRFQDLF